LGDVVCAVIGGQERFFVCKRFKIVSPLEWDVSLSPSVLHFFDLMQPDVSIEDLSAKMSEPLTSALWDYRACGIFKRQECSFILDS
jgi:hypothetical protein